MKPVGSVAALVAAVQDDAAAEADAAENEADQAVARILADHAGRLPSGSDDRRAIDAARDRARVRVAQEDWEDARDAIAEREAWIAKAVEIGKRRLGEPQTPEERRRLLSSLAREAIVRLPPGPLEIVVAEADAPALDRDWRAGLVAPADPDQVRIVIAPIGGGLVLRSGDGRATFDNTFAARANRLESAWRAALADLYERATSSLASPARPLPEG
jgi:vacuolar-type H+-ATPase subunit E/Vma4